MSNLSFPMAAAPDAQPADDKIVLLVRDPGIPQAMLDGAAQALEGAGYHVTMLPMLEPEDDLAALVAASSVVALIGSQHATAMDTWMGVACAMATPIFPVADSPQLRQLLKSLDRPALFLQPQPTLSITEAAGGGKGWAKLLATMALHRTIKQGGADSLAWHHLAEAFEGPQ